MKKKVFEHPKMAPWEKDRERRERNNDTLDKCDTIRKEKLRVFDI